MCGILGTVNYEELPFHVYKKLMVHRGPDNQAHTRIRNVDFYHYRLSIQDLTLDGNQPMNYKQFTIIFNGEIYNHLELRRKFGIKDSSNSDTITILKLYEILGEKMLNEFDGMFAFAIYDNQNHSMFMARDRAGKKPFYYYFKDKKFVFSSEQNALYSVVKPEIRNYIINDYFFLGSQFQEQTVFKDVNELRNGHYLKLDLNSFSKKEVKWWDIRDHYNEKLDLNFEEAKNVFNTSFDLAVKRRIESSDLEVGSFLSGGIDSGLVTAFASKYVSKLRTFTVAFDGGYNEAPLAKLVAKKFETDHREIKISFSNLKKDFETIITNYGEPYMDSSAIPSFYVSKEAKKYVTVILNGDGADELFGGYRRYVPFSKYDFFESPRYVKGAFGVLNKVLPLANNKQSYYNYLRRLISLGSKEAVDCYLSSTSDVFTGFENKFTNPPQLMRFREEFDLINGSLNSGLDKIMCLDFNNLLFGDLLVKMDIATMAHSLEGRSPFLSKELIEFAPKLKSNLKIKMSTTKHLLREVARNKLPIEIFTQPKRGFEVPLKKWIDDDLNEVVMDYLSNGNPFYSNFIDRSFISKLINKKVRVSNEKRAKMLFSLLCLEVWYKNLNRL